VEYAVSPHIRSRIVVVLNQGVYSVTEIADIIREPLNNVGNHIHELLEAGSIEIAETKKVRNFSQHYLQRVPMPFFSKSEAKAMTWQARQVMACLIVQSLLSEIMVALWAGKIFNDPLDWFVFDRLELDAEGRQELYEEQEAYWDRIKEIKTGSTDRVAESGDDTTAHVVAVLGFEGGLRAREPSCSPDGD
jgi:hypothetical protein